ncbi:MAG: response regulator [Elusimicrobiales bacterium]
MKKVLIVDDSISFLLLAKEALESEYKVEIFCDFSQIKDIISKIEGYMPDVLLLDINLGGFTGINVLEEMKKKSSISKIPVIFLTASDYNIINERLTKSEKNVMGFYSKLDPLEFIKEKINSIISKE